MFKAIAQIFRAIFVFASATEKVAQSFNNLASIGVDESEGLKNQLTVEREARLARLRADLRDVAKLEAA